MSKRILAPTLLVILVATLLSQLPSMAKERDDAYAWFTPVQDVLYLVQRQYVEEIDDERKRELQLGAINGMLEVLDDPYTEYIPKQEQKNFDKDIRGKYVGIGASVNMQNGWLTIVTPMAGSPALEAGIEAGDQIRVIDGKTTEGENINDSIERLMGEPDTQVVVQVHREGTSDDELLELTVIRGRIDVQTIEGVHRRGEDWDYYIDPTQKIAYVRLSQFTQTTGPDLRKVMEQLVDEGMTGLVMDLRANPGGSLGAAIEVSDLFIPEGLIVTIKGRATPERSASAEASGTLPDFPMVVLVNGHSASASEIVSGSLQENGRAKVIGTRTFGKGKVQDVRALRSGEGQLKITSAFYYLKSGRTIQRLPDEERWGVDPDPNFYVPMTDMEFLQVRRIQRDLDIIKANNGDGDWSDPEWVEQKLEDEQLAAAVDALRMRLADGAWTPTGEEMDLNVEFAAELRRAELRRELLMAEIEDNERDISRLLALMPREDSDRQDLIPEEDRAADGTVEVKDAEGNVISVLRIDDPAMLEAALMRARIKLADDGNDSEDSSEKSEPDEDQ